MLIYEITDNDFHDFKYLLKTPATGGHICDYWIVPDKIANPQ